MTMNPLPPQAYTKETLLKAYQWLMGQNASLKEIATTPDILVSLYLKATRDGDHALERPSIKNFKNELRNLAGIMSDLDRPVGAQAHPQQMPLPPQQQPSVYQQQQQAPAMAPSPAQAVQMMAAVEPQAAPVAHHHVAPQTHAPVHVHAPQPQAQHPATTTQVSYTEKTLTATQTLKTADMMEVLDCSTRAMIQEVKDEFNLSSEVEALRMLVKVGYSRSKGLIG